ncbi:MAG TPA: GvpL/GvpF family gas vesicle protein [Gemmatimonadaceae bacterium]|nr:GvpL/GvpF family gas vesicle protein [Gemmatimonadaceae bacterium]
MADSVYYVYAVVPPGTVAAVAPAGVDGARVELIANDNVAALVSRVDGAAYGVNVDDLVADVAWLGPRATAHDAVLTWASDVGAVVPLPLLSLFRSGDAVRDMLAARRDHLARLLDHVARGREYGVRIFRLDDELRAVLGEHSSAIAALESDVAAAPSPGQGYLLARKLEAARKDELRRVAAMIANTAYVDLVARSLEATQDALPKATAEQSGAAVLNASFLVAHERVDDFRAAVTAFMRDHDRRGFRVEFTGPWPPYHFTRSVADVR